MRKTDLFFFTVEWIPSDNKREGLSILHSSSQDAEIKVSPREMKRKWEIILVITGRCYFSAGISP